MTENEAKLEKVIAEDYKAVLHEAKSMGCNNIRALYNIPLKNMELIIKALEEVQQYRAIGTPEECLRNKDFLRFLANSMNQKKYETYLRIYNAVEKDGRDGKVGGVDGN